MLRKIACWTQQQSTWTFCRRLSAAAHAPRDDPSDLAATLQSFTAAGDPRGGAAIHARIIKLHVSASRPFSLWNKLLNVYSSIGHHRLAYLLFDEMPERDTVSFNTLISARIRCSRNPLESLHIYWRMLDEGVKPNGLTLSALLSGYNAMNHPRIFLQIHSHAIKLGLGSDEFIGGALVKGYQNLTGLKDAISAFEEINNVDIVSWNIMIDACAHSGDKESVVDVFFRMRLENAGSFDSFAITSVLKTCEETRDLDFGVQLHGCSLKVGLDSDTPVGNALLTMYSRCEKGIDSASQIFMRISKPNIISYTAMIGAFVQSKMPKKAIIFYREMIREDISENEFCFTSVLPACSELSCIELGRMVHGRIVKSEFQYDIGVFNALMDLYFKCGSLEDASLVFEAMNHVDVMSWTIMISGFGQHGKGREAIEFFGLMKERGFVPDDVTFLGALSACRHGGLVNEGFQIFKSMIDEYGIKPRREHFSCLIDLFGRVGRLEEGERFIEEMGLEFDPFVWETLLGSCEIYGEVKMGKRSAEKVMLLKPRSDGAYVTLSNIYAAGNMWEDKGKLRQRLDWSGLTKEAAQSWV